MRRSNIYAVFHVIAILQVSQVLQLSSFPLKVRHIVHLALLESMVGVLVLYLSQPFF
jgi:hypothetical protein